MLTQRKNYQKNLISNIFQEFLNEMQAEIWKADMYTFVINFNKQFF